MEDIAVQNHRPHIGPGIGNARLGHALLYLGQLVRCGGIPCDLPGQLGILPFDLLFLGHAGEEIAVELRGLLRYPLIVKVGIGLNGLMFPFLHLQGLVLQDTPLPSAVPSNSPAA